MTLSNVPASQRGEVEYPELPMSRFEVEITLKQLIDLGY
jgi:hypothetical protein